MHFTSVPHGLHLITWVFLSFLKVWIPHKVQTINLTSIASSRRLHEKNPKRKLQFAVKSQAISGRISVTSYAISERLLDAKVSQVMPCFNIIWKSKGSLLTMHLIFNLSLNFIVTYICKLIYFHSNSYRLLSNLIMTSQSILLFSLTFSGVSVSVILNKCILPAVLHNFIGM